MKMAKKFLAVAPAAPKSISQPAYTPSTGI